MKTSESIRRPPWLGKGSSSRGSFLDVKRKLVVVSPSSILSNSNRLPRRIPPALALTVLSIALAVSVIVATGIGAVFISPRQVIGILSQPFFELEVPFTRLQETVLYFVRLPRVLLGVLTGAGLGASGAALQGLFRNPLADPGLIGVSSGGALAAACVIVIGSATAPVLFHALSIYALPVAAFLGGLAVALLTHRLATIGRQTSLPLMLLSGIAINAVAGACIGALTYFASDEQLRNLTFWSLGSLGGTSWRILGVAAPCVLIGTAVLLRTARALNAMSLGEREASLLGVNVERLKYTVIASAALVVGTLVAVTGIIGFVGLVAPHMVRLSCGPNQKLVLPASGLLGGILVVLADLAARILVAPAEMPIGILTALLGAPIFLGLLLTERRRLIP